MALLAEALMHEVAPPDLIEVQGAIQELQERAIVNRLRELRAGIAEAERRGDFAELAVLLKRKQELDQTLRRLHDRWPGGSAA